MVRSFAFAVMLSCVVACAGQIASLPGPRLQVAAPSGVEEIAKVGEVGEAGEAGPAPIYAPGEDRHWMQPDDYFISDQPWQQGWIYVHLAKMKRPPTAESKNQALFFQLDNSRDMWTEHYWRTRPATAGELALGALVLCFNDNERDSVYHSPRSKDRARTGAWFMGKITDVSDAYKHQVRVDVYSCAINAVRVVGR